jgi:elongation factor Ts
MISAKLVKELRETTGAGMMDCKKALVESNGDLSNAIDFLRKAGIAKAAKKSGRSTSDGAVVTYIHPGAKLGVMVEINCETDFVARTDAFQNFTKDVAMHIAAASPSVVRREELDQDAIDKEREILKEQAIQSGKKAEFVDRIVDGRIEKYYAEHVLLEQTFVKDQDKTIKDLVTEVIASLGENIGIARFARFELGANQSKTESE